MKQKILYIILTLCILIILFLVAILYTKNDNMKYQNRNKNTKQSIIKIDEIVFVLLDENGKPKPHGKGKK